MRRALFDILCVGDAIEQVYSVAANVTDLRRAVSILKGMVNEVSEIVQLDLLDAASSQLWVRHISKEPQAGTASPDKMWESLNTAAGGLHSYWVASIRKAIEIPTWLRAAYFAFGHPAHIGSIVKCGDMVQSLLSCQGKFLATN